MAMSHVRVHNPPLSPPFIRFQFNTNCSITLPIMEYSDANTLRSEFLQLLRSRRTAQVPLPIKPAQPIRDPLYQETTRPTFSEVMESCPRKEIPNFKELLQEENLYLFTEIGASIVLPIDDTLDGVELEPSPVPFLKMGDALRHEGEQGRLPVLILKMRSNSDKRRPTIVFLHSTHKCKEWLRPLLEAYASRDYITVAIDSRHHGERARNFTTYQDALISSWKKGDTMPFIYDTVWDLLKLADYLSEREDVDPSRIGITGESLGGMHAWFAAAADTRYAVVAPIIGVQGFQWAIEHDNWRARVDSIKGVFEEARIDLEKDAIDKEVVEKVWDRIAPGLAACFDSPYTIPAIAPRPLLILNGKEDPRCPPGGLELPQSRAMEAYKNRNSVENFKVVVEPGIGHRMTPLMVKLASNWFDQHL